MVATWRVKTAARWPADPSHGLKMANMVAGSSSSSKLIKAGSRERLLDKALRKKARALQIEWSWNQCLSIAGLQQGRCRISGQVRHEWTTVHEVNSCDRRWQSSTLATLRKKACALQTQSSWNQCPSIAGLQQGHCRISEQFRHDWTTVHEVNSCDRRWQSSTLATNSVDVLRQASIRWFVFSTSGTAE